MTTRKPYPSDVSDEEWAFVAPYLALVREDGPRFACTLATFGGQSTRSEGNHTGLPHPAIHAGERLSGRLRRGEAQEGCEGTRGGGYPGTPARVACDTSQRA